jgi:hypothetical protein
MQKKLMALLTSIALAGVTAACKDRRYGEDKDQVAGKPLDDQKVAPPVAAAEQGGTTNAAGEMGDMEDKTIAAADPAAKHDIDNARSTYGVNVTGAEAVAHFTPAGSNKLRGIAAIDGQALTVAVADATPGKYLIELSAKPACDPSKSSVTAPAGSPENRTTSTNVPGIAQDRSGGTADSPGFSGQGTFETAKGDHVLGFLVVGQDGQGRFEANINGELIANADNQTIVIKSSEGVDISRGELRGSVACGELSPADEQGA